MRKIKTPQSQITACEKFKKRQVFFFLISYLS